MEDRQGVPLWAIVGIVVASVLAIGFVGNWLKRRRAGSQKRPRNFWDPWDRSLLLRWVVLISGVVNLARACSIYR